MLTSGIVLGIFSATALLDVLPPEYGWPLFAAGFLLTAVSLRAAAGARWPLGRPKPMELPPLPDTFRGRERELADLVAAHDRWSRERAPATVFIQGPPRIGKAVMAARLAKELADRYPDGVLHFDLGYSEEARLADALRHFLTALKQPPQAEDPLDTLQTSLRRTIQGRRILFVVTRARVVGHVEILLPNEPGCGLIVTSRAVLAPSLQRPQTRLDEPDTATAIAIVLAVAKDEGADADSLAVVVEHTERYPPALVAAGQAAFEQDALGWVAARYGNQDPASTGVPGSVADVTEGYQQEYDRLSDEEKRAYELLSQVSAGTFVPWVLRPLSACAGRPIGHVEATITMSDLATAGLLMAIDSPDVAIRKCFPRYRFPPLARRHAARLLRERGEPVPAALRRGFAHAVLLAAAEVLEIPVTRPPEAADWMPEEQGWREGIKQSESFWIRAEHVNLVEAVFTAEELGEGAACAGLAARLGGAVGAPAVPRRRMAGMFAAARHRAGREPFEVDLAHLAYQVAVEDHGGALATADRLLTTGAEEAKVLRLKAQSLQRVGDYAAAGQALRAAQSVTGRAVTGKVIAALLQDNDAVLRPRDWRAVPDGLVTSYQRGDGDGSLVTALINARCAARRGDWEQFEKAMRAIESVRAWDVAWAGTVACERVQRRLDHAWPSPPDDLDTLQGEGIRGLLAFQAVENVPGQVRARTQLARVLLARCDAEGGQAQIEQARTALATLGDPAIVRLQAGLDWVQGEADLTGGGTGKAESAQAALLRAERAYQSTGEFWHLACVRVRLAEAERQLDPPGPFVHRLLLQAALAFDSCGDVARRAHCVALAHSWS